MSANRNRAGEKQAFCIKVHSSCADKWHWELKMGPGLPWPSGSFPSNRDLSPSGGYLLIKLCVHFSNSFIRVLWLKTHFQSQNESCRSVPGAKRIGKKLIGILQINWETMVELSTALLILVWKICWCTKAYLKNKISVAFAFVIFFWFWSLNFIVENLNKEI